MGATMLAPAATSPAKLVQMRAYGATVERIEGTREDTAAAASARAETIFYASHNWHPFFLQGTKTLAYELWEDSVSGRRTTSSCPAAPDRTCWDVRSGSANCSVRASSPTCHGCSRRSRPTAPLSPGPTSPVADEAAEQPDIRPTLAEGTAIAHPIRLQEVLGALRETTAAP